MSVSLESHHLGEVPNVSALDAVAVDGHSPNRVYSLDPASSDRSRTSVRGVLTAVTLLCFALLAAGIHLGQRGIVREQSREWIQSPSNRGKFLFSEGDADKTGGSDAAAPSVAAGRTDIASKIKEQEERIASLKETVQSAKECLRKKEEGLVGLQKERDEAIATAELLQDADRELGILESRAGKDVSRREADELIEAIEVAKTELKWGEAENIAKALDEQKEILQREEALAAQREKDISDQQRQAAATHEDKASVLKEAIASLASAVAEDHIKLEAMEDVKRQVEQLAATLEEIEGRVSDLTQVGSYMEHWQDKFDEATLADVALREVFRKYQAGMLVSSSGRTIHIVRQVVKEIQSYPVEISSFPEDEWTNRKRFQTKVQKAVGNVASASELIAVSLYDGRLLIHLP